MKQLSAILLISLFAFSQYARQLSYLECKFSNNFKTSAEKCDCETKSGITQEDNNNSFPKTHTHLHPDEFFALANRILPGLRSFIVKQVKLDLKGADESDGVYTEPWQPPPAGSLATS